MYASRLPASWVKGAFTGAVSNREGRFDAADGGTLFLDEIGELDAASQVKLLRALQEHAYEPVGSSATRRSDFRVVAATNADLPAMIADGRFREVSFAVTTMLLPELSVHISPRMGTSVMRSTS